MRINVYSQEMTGEIRRIEKRADTGKVYTGIRFILDSSPRLHDTPLDDDRSGVTFWCADDGRTMDRFAIARILELAALELRRENP